jgi:hypothetical protein
VPFQWVQSLAAEQPLTDGVEVRDYFGEVAGAITSRVAAADLLSSQLARLAGLDCSLPETLVAPLPVPPAPPVARLAAWRRVAGEDELTPAARASLPCFPSWLGHGLQLYAGEVRRDDIALGVTVMLFADFPRTPPHAALHCAVEIAVYIVSRRLFL